MGSRPATVHKGRCRLPHLHGRGSRRRGSSTPCPCRKTARANPSPRAQIFFQFLFYLNGLITFYRKCRRSALPVDDVAPPDGGLRQGGWTSGSCAGSKAKAASLGKGLSTQAHGPARSAIGAAPCRRASSSSPEMGSLRSSCAGRGGPGAHIGTLPQKRGLVPGLRVEGIARCAARPWWRGVAALGARAAPDRAPVGGRGRRREIHRRRAGAGAPPSRPEEGRFLRGPRSSNRFQHHTRVVARHGA